jgi:alkylhydroperoxidase family enzyme
LSGPRIEPLEAEEALARAREAKVLEPMAELNVFRTLLHQPQVAKQINDLLITLLFKSRLDARLRELVILRIGWVTGSDYEWTQHWRVALQLGIPEADLRGVRDWQDHPGFSAADRAVLAATDETLVEGRVGDVTWAALERELASTEERIELVASIGCWHLISQMLQTLGVEVEEGVESWPPDGRRPTTGTAS